MVIPHRDPVTGKWYSDSMEEIPDPESPLSICGCFGDPPIRKLKWYQLLARFLRWWRRRRIRRRIRNFTKFRFPAVRQRFPDLRVDEIIKTQPMVDSDLTKEQLLAHLPNVQPRCPDGSPDWDTHMRLCGGCEDCRDPKERD